MAKSRAVSVIGVKIKSALDGRTQRWLAIKTGIPEDKLSNKIKGLTPFTEDDIKKINRSLNVTI